MKKKDTKKVLYLKEGEEVVIVKKDHYYRLGYPVLDIVLGEKLLYSKEVYWCEVEQNWRDYE
jgi:hypothetical protein